ncbi:MAG: hypothetical protein LBV12_08825 [Puniceicoccales bacterium]|jgi:hypothetical protein|nr:hypothetical protein [Puniceicoccales bacterium]
MKTPEQIIVAVSQAFGVKISDLMAIERGDVVISDARFAAMLLMREGRRSYIAIGKFFSRDHSTIIHGVNRAKELIDLDLDYRTKIGVARETSPDDVRQTAEQITTNRASMYVEYYDAFGTKCTVKGDIECVVAHILRVFGDGAVKA